MLCYLEAAPRATTRGIPKSADEELSTSRMPLDLHPGYLGSPSQGVKRKRAAPNPADSEDSEEKHELKPSREKAKTDGYETQSWCQAMVPDRATW